MRREEEILRKRMLEEQRAAEEAAEIAELRRLPTTEGGLAFVAEPVNSIFYQHEEEEYLEE